MKKNISKPDFTIRLICGIIAIALVFTPFPEDDFLSMCLLAFGILMIVTAALRYCPLYHFLGINTASSSNKPKMY